MKKQLHLTIFIAFLGLNVNSQSWLPVGSGLNSEVDALITYNGDLIAAGYIYSSSNSIKEIWKWNGTSWSALGANFDNEAFAFAVYKGDLYVGGIFNHLGNGTVVANGIAKWDGTNWSAVGTGVTGVPLAGVRALAVYNGELYAGGQFSIAGGNPANYIAKWDGVSWSSVGSGMNPWVVSGTNPNVLALSVCNNQLYAGGYFIYANGNPVNHIAKWDGTNWTSVGTGFGSFVYSLTTDTVNNILYAGGGFITAGGNPANHIAKWNGTNWSALGTGMNNEVNSMEFNNGVLYAGGYFTTAGGNPANYIAKWNGVNWSSLGAGMNNWVWSIANYNGSIYAGGDFTTAGGNSANYIAKWYSTTTNIENNLIKNNNLIVYPNPVSDQFYIETNTTDKLNVEIYDVNGKQLFSKSVSDKSNIDVSTINEGFYTLIIKTTDSIINKKLVILR